MKEKTWPQVDISNVNPDWWDDVMKTTAHFQQYFSQELDDDADFTIRGIVHIVIGKNRRAVEWLLNGSVQSERILTIHDLLHSSEADNKVKGARDLINLIKDYTNDVLDQGEHQ